MYEKWIKDGLKKPGKSAVGLAKALTKALKLKTSMHRGTIYKMMAGTRKIYSNELAPIAEYLEETVPNMPVQSSLENLQTLRVDRDVAAGVWLDGDKMPAHDPETIVVPTDFEHPSAEHFAFRMAGNSMVASGILDGDTIICIATNEALTDGKLVIVERKRAGLTETSARVARVFKDRIEYVCENNKPIVVVNNAKKKDADVIRVVAIIRRVTRILK